MLPSSGLVAVTVAPITIDADPERVEFVVERHLADRLFRAGATAAAKGGGSFSMNFASSRRARGARELPVAA